MAVSLCIVLLAGQNKSGKNYNKSQINSGFSGILQKRKNQRENETKINKTKVNARVRVYILYIANA